MDNNKDLKMIACPIEAVDKFLEAPKNILAERERLSKLKAQIVLDAANDYIQAAETESERFAAPYHLPRLISSAAILQRAIADNLDHSSIGAFIELIVANAESAKQTAAALKRHADNHALRDEIYAWMDANYKKGMALDDAASIISEKIVPLKWRTVRDHLTAWRKLRSTGTP